jgi:stage II sporulation protein D
MSSLKRKETKVSRVKKMSSFFFLFFIFLISIFQFSLFNALAETTIRILLSNGKNAMTPGRDEKIEKIGNQKGEVLLSGVNYRGIIEIWKGERGLYVVNEVPLEEYVKGVVSSEVGNNWEIEALKAQAVVARTYAVYQMIHNSKKPYHITSSVLDQVYKSGNISKDIEKAVEETKGEILTYDGEPIIAFYHSTSGGMTEDPVEVFGKSYPYLKPIETSCENSPYYVWEKRIPISEIEEASGIRGVKEIYINEITASNRTRNLKFITEDGEYIVLAKDLRKNLGWDRLPSTMITNISKDNNIFIFEGKGYGHGVGMCQWTALNMAKKGMNYKEILSRFYPNTTIQLYEK